MTAPQASPVTQGHTPGPWRISQNVSRHVIGPKGGVVACSELTWDGPGSSEIADANARLIAAAPDLLAALLRCKFDSLNMTLDDLAFCRAAILKATGAAA